ncbi:MAG TPA: DMT family transporter [Verrucomicrobiae bacterium]|nr:DMT family transporter [Verrucomicrobiae bacterium]
MLAAFLTTIFFSISVICGNRSAQMIGGSEANFWRLTCATGFLALWAWTFGQGLSGESFPLFLLSGVIGIGIGDVALFQTLPRLGSRLTLMLVQCLTAPFGAAIEWLWLGTQPKPMQMICAAIILVGIGISLAPGKNLHLQKRAILPGIVFSLMAALGNAFGAVLSRKAYEVAHDHGEHNIDGGTAAFQRILGGLLIGGISLLVVKWRTIKGHLMQSGENGTLPSKEKWRRVLPWVLANSLAGQTLGVSCYQWAFQTTPTYIVLPIVATTPLVAIPISMAVEKERPSARSLVGGAVAVAGVIGLALLK